MASPSSSPPSVAILGPDLEPSLRSIGEELRGRPAEPDETYVPKRAMLRAVRRQNEVILALHARMIDMSESEAGLRRTVDELRGEVRAFREESDRRVGGMESTLREKVPLIDRAIESAETGGEEMDRLREDVSSHASSLSRLEGESRVAILDVRDGISALSRTVEDMPGTMRISSGQVVHGGTGGGGGEDGGDSSGGGGVIGGGGEGETTTTLADLISRQEERSHRLEEGARLAEERVERQLLEQKMAGANRERELVSLKLWKERQSSVDLVAVREGQEDVSSRVESIENDMRGKMSRVDVDERLDAQFREIVEHLRAALESVESDEADFKAVTDSLSRMCRTLGEKKADRSEIASLRRQFVDNQVGGGGGGASPRGGGGATLDNEGIRSILMNYPTSAAMDQVLRTKADENAVASRLDRLESLLRDVREELDRPPPLIVQRAGGGRNRDSNKENRRLPLRADGGTGGNNVVSPQETTTTTKPKPIPHGWESSKEPVGGGRDDAPNSNNKRAREGPEEVADDPRSFPPSSIEREPLRSYVDDDWEPTSSLADDLLLLRARSIRPSTAPSSGAAAAAAASGGASPKRKSTLPEIQRRLRTSPCVTLGGGGGCCGPGRDRRRLLLPLAESRAVVVAASAADAGGGGGREVEGEFYIGSGDGSPGRPRVRVRGRDGFVD